MNLSVELPKSGDIIFYTSLGAKDLSDTYEMHRGVEILNIGEGLVEFVDNKGCIRILMGSIDIRFSD